MSRVLFRLTLAVLVLFSSSTSSADDANKIRRLRGFGWGFVALGSGLTALGISRLVKDDCEASDECADPLAGQAGGPVALAVGSSIAFGAGMPMTLRARALSRPSRSAEAIVSKKTRRLRSAGWGAVGAGLGITTAGVILVATDCGSDCHDDDELFRDTVGAGLLFSGFPISVAVGMPMLLRARGLSRRLPLLDKTEISVSPTLGGVVFSGRF